MLPQLLSELNLLADAERAKNLQRYFRTGAGEYGEGDVFLGLKMGEVRQLVKEYLEIGFAEIQKLLDSEIHEHRMTGLLILAGKFKKAEKKERAEIFEFYLKNARRANNWDLVDLSAPNIVGTYLKDKDRKILYKFAGSNNLWERRIAIVSTFAFIQEGKIEDTLKISKILLDDKQDLIHKAVGWALREVGKRDEKVLENFLKTHYKKIPRTTLRYAIERFGDEKRKKFLRGEI